MVAHLGLSCCWHITHKLLQKWSKKSWSSEANTGECLAISIDDTLNSLDFRVAHITVDRETVTNPVCTHVSWNTSKAEKWEWSISIIWLYYISNITDCCFVLVVCSEIVERAGWWWITIRCCVVDGTHHRDTPASSQIIDKSWSFEKFPISKDKLRTSVSYIRVRSSLNLIHSQLNLIDLSISTLCPNWESYLCISVVVAQISKCDLLQREIEVWRCLLEISTAPYLSKLICSRDLTSYFEPDGHSFSPNSDKASAEIVQILPAHLKSCTKVGCLDGFGPHNYFASVRRALGN